MKNRIYIGGIGFEETKALGKDGSWFYGGERSLKECYGRCSFTKLYVWDFWNKFFHNYKYFQTADVWIYSHNKETFVIHAEAIAADGNYYRFEITKWHDRILKIGDISEL